MTTRPITIDLRARTRQYERSMHDASRATAGLKGNLSSLFTGAAKAGAAGVAVAIAAVGAAAIKVGIEAATGFAKFETTMSRIEGLVGLSADQVESFGESISDISVATARGPQELAEALFFITSAGLEGESALDALTVSAKAATAGLGDTAVIADVVTSAMNAYGDVLGGAAVATDVLVATVREGKAEASSLASAMGRVIPIASQMGISFVQVGAAIAAMTRVGLDANEASTALRGIMNSLLKPTSDAEKALASVGLSAKGLREEIRDKGLFQALQTITTAFEGQDDATVRVFGNVRALTGVLSLMGSNADATEQIFSDLADSTGSLDSAFGAAADTGAFAFEQAKVRIENALLAVGEKILPDLADAIDDIAPKLPELVEGIGTVTVALVDMGVAIIGPLADAFSQLDLYILGAQKAMLEFKRSVNDTRLVGFFDVVLGPGINFTDPFTDNDQVILSFVNTQIKVRNAIEDNIEPMQILKLAMRDMTKEGSLTAESIQIVADTLGLTPTQIGTATESLYQAGAAAGFTKEQWELYLDVTQPLTDAVKRTAAEQANASEVARLLGASQRYAAQQAVEAAPLFEEPVTPLDELSTALREAEEANRSLADAMLEMTDPTFKAAKAVAALEQAQKKAKEVGEDSKSTADDIADAQLAVVEAALKAQGALDSLSPTNLEAAIESITTVLGISRDEAGKLLEQLGILDGTTVSTVVEIESRITGPLSGALGGLEGIDFKFGGPRALGGRAERDVPYLVGEAGEEMFVPDQSGTIIPNSNLTQNNARSISIDMSGSSFTSDIDVQAAIQAGLIAGGVTESVEWAGTTTIR